MDKYIIDRIKQEADQILLTKMTIREIAKLYGISKSTVHKDLNERLLEIDPIKQRQIKEIFQEHIEVRHIRGGESTKRKYLHLS